MAEANIGSSGKQFYNSKQLAYGLLESPTVCTIKGVQFIPTSMPVQIGGDIKEYKDSTGVVAALVIPETYQTVQITGYLIHGTGSGASDIHKGDEIEGLPQVDGLADATWRVQDFSINWANEEVANVNITARGYTF